MSTVRVALACCAMTVSCIAEPPPEQFAPAGQKFLGSISESQWADWEIWKEWFSLDLSAITAWATTGAQQNATLSCLQDERREVSCPAPTVPPPAGSSFLGSQAESRGPSAEPPDDRCRGPLAGVYGFVAIEPAHFGWFVDNFNRLVPKSVANAMPGLTQSLPAALVSRVHGAGELLFFYGYDFHKGWSWGVIGITPSVFGIELGFVWTAGDGLAPETVLITAPLTLPLGGFAGLYSDLSFAELGVYLGVGGKSLRIAGFNLSVGVLISFDSGALGQLISSDYWSANCWIEDTVGVEIE